MLSLFNDSSDTNVKVTLGRLQEELINGSLCFSSDDKGTQSHNTIHLDIINIEESLHPDIEINITLNQITTNILLLQQIRNLFIGMDVDELRGLISIILQGKKVAIGYQTYNKEQFLSYQAPIASKIHQENVFIKIVYTPEMNVNDLSRIIGSFNPPLENNGNITFSAQQGKTPYTFFALSLA